MSDQTQPAPTVTEDIEKRTAQFIQVRDMIKAKEDAHKKMLAPLREIQDTLAGRIQAFMNLHSLTNLKTNAGTCYTSSRSTASVADAEAFMKFVTTSGQFDLLDRRANATAVKDFVEKNKALPPGVNYSTIVTLGVRRKGSGGSDSE